MTTEEKELNEITKITHPSLKVIEILKNNDVLVECQDCKQIYTIKKRSLTHSQGPCQVCQNKKIISGYNDALTLNPWLEKYLDKEDLKQVSTMASYNSKIEIKSKCPFCGYERIIYLRNLVSSKSKCPACADGVSYPNKFGRIFLKQLPIQNLIIEYNPKWAGKKKYDNYFEYNNQSYILEMDGGFHFIETNLNVENLEKRQLLDKEKDRLAQEHNIIVIRIDCKKSSLEYIKSKILKSELNKIFDLSNIDWNLCNEEATNNLVVQICKDINKEQYNFYNDIVNKYNISISTIEKYIRKGIELGLCDREKMKKYSYKNRFKFKYIDVEVFNENKQLIGIYKSISEAERELNKIYEPNIHFVRSGISTSMNYSEELKSSYKGFYFRRKEKEN